MVTEIRRMHKSGRPTLVGTTSVERSEALAKLLDEDGALRPAMPLFKICTSCSESRGTHDKRLRQLEGWLRPCLCVGYGYAYSNSLLRHWLRDAPTGQGQSIL